MNFQLCPDTRIPRRGAIVAPGSTEHRGNSDKSLLAAAISKLRESEAALALIAAQMDEPQPRESLETSMESLRAQAAFLDGLRSSPDQPPQPDRKRPDCELSPREQEVLGWITRGKTNAEIAIILDISRHTVDTHIRRTFGKLGTTDRTSTAIKAVVEGLLAD